MIAMLAAAIYSRIGFSIYFAVRARRVRVPDGSKFHLEPETIKLSPYLDLFYSLCYLWMKYFSFKHFFYLLLPPIDLVSFSFLFLYVWCCILKLTMHKINLIKLLRKFKTKHTHMAILWVVQVYQCIQWSSVVKVVFWIECSTYAF